MSMSFYGLLSRSLPISSNATFWKVYISLFWRSDRIFSSSVLLRDRCSSRKYEPQGKHLGEKGKKTEPESISTAAAMLGPTSGKAIPILYRNIEYMNIPDAARDSFLYCPAPLTSDFHVFFCGYPYKLSFVFRSEGCGLFQSAVWSDTPDGRILTTAVWGFILSGKSV